MPTTPAPTNPILTSRLSLARPVDAAGRRPRVCPPAKSPARPRGRSPARRPPPRARRRPRRARACSASRASPVASAKSVSPSNIVCAGRIALREAVLRHLRDLVRALLRQPRRSGDDADGRVRPRHGACAPVRRPRPGSRRRAARCRGRRRRRERSPRRPRRRRCRSAAGRSPCRDRPSSRPPGRAPSRPSPRYPRRPSPRRTDGRRPGRRGSPPRSRAWLTASRRPGRRVPPPGRSALGRRPRRSRTPRSSRYRITPSAAASPKALPPVSRTAWTSCTRFVGRSRSVSRVPGAEPRTSTPPTAPAGAEDDSQARRADEVSVVADQHAGHVGDRVENVHLGSSCSIVCSVSQCRTHGTACQKQASPLGRAEGAGDSRCRPVSVVADLSGLAVVVPRVWSRAPLLGPVSSLLASEGPGRLASGNIALVGDRCNDHARRGEASRLPMLVGDRRSPERAPPATWRTTLARLTALAKSGNSRAHTPRCMESPSS